MCWDGIIEDMEKLKELVLRITLSLTENLFCISFEKSFRSKEKLESTEDLLAESLPLT